MRSGMKKRLGVEPPLKVLEEQSDLSECRDYGKKIAERMR